MSIFPHTSNNYKKNLKVKILLKTSSIQEWKISKTATDKIIRLSIDNHKGKPQNSQVFRLGDAIVLKYLFSSCKNISSLLKYQQGFQEPEKLIKSLL